MALSMFLITKGISQDFHFSQFYAAPLYLNPAFAGSTELTRMGANYRKQWPGLGHDFNSYSAYFDHYIFDYNSGIGMAVNVFEETHMKLKFTDIGAYYSYNLTIYDDVSLRFGGQVSYIMRNAALDNLVFGDQVNLFDRSIAPVTMDDLPLQDPVNYFDFSFGSLLITDDFWLGASAHHVTRPQYSFFQDDPIHRLPVRWSVHGGYVFDMNFSDNRSNLPENFFSLSANYKQQGTFRQLDLGMQRQYKELILGLGYRGFRSYEELPHQSSIIGLVGIAFDTGITFGYSYDVMLSSYSRGTGGAHEVSIRYAWFAGDPRQRNQRRTILNCIFY